MVDVGRGSLRRHGVHGAAWGLGERWFARAGNLLVLLVLGRLLVPEDFGTVAAASVLVDLVGMLAGTGVAAFIVRSPENDRVRSSTVTWFCLGLGLILSAGVLLGAPFMATLLKDDSLTPVIWALSPVIVLGTVTEVPTGMLQRDFAFRALAFRSVAAVVVSSAVAVVMALNGFGAWSLVAQTLTFYFLRAVAVWVMAGWFPAFVVDRGVLRELGVFSGKLVGLSALNFARTRGEDLLIAATLGAGGLGLWVIAKKVVLVAIDVITGVAVQVANPLFAAARHDADRLARGYIDAVRVSTSMMAPVLSTLAAVSSLAIPLLFGEQWSSAGPVAAALALGYVFITSAHMDRALYLALDRVGLEVAISAVLVALHLGLVGVVLWVGGTLTHVAWALAIFCFLTTPVRLLVASRVLHVRFWPMLGRLLRVWAACAPGAICAYLVTSATPLGSGWGALAAGICLGLLVYPLSLWIVSRADFTILIRLTQSAFGRSR